MNDLKVEKLGENYYHVSSPYADIQGLYVRLDGGKFKVRLDTWRDGKTNRIRTYKNKLYNHTCNWFAYIIDEYGGE